MLDIQPIVTSLLYLPLISLVLGLVFCKVSFKPSSQTLLGLRVFETITAGLILLWTFTNGHLQSKILSIKVLEDLKFEIGFRGDALSSIVLFVVSLLSLCIFRYSIRYLDGDKKQSDFFFNFQLTVLSVSLLTLSDNLLMLFLAWLGTSLGLHRLLLHYNDRPLAVLAARKKWWVSRLGDLCLLAGIVLTYLSFKTFSFEELFEIAKNQDLINNASKQSELAVIGLLFVIGAMTKSAQFPFHFWLPETMETPTPVSALMHAGIINAGGYLIIRLSPLLTHAPSAHEILTVVGGVTAVFGALVMMTQTDVKRYLAYSTVSQLGFMMIECGLGLYNLALFHIIAHGFYKANAFLSTGTLLSEVKPPKRNVTWSSLAISTSLAVIFIAIGMSFGNDDLGGKASAFVYFGLLSFALAQVIGSRMELKRALTLTPIKTVGFISAGIGIYYAFEKFGSFKLVALMPKSFDVDALWFWSVSTVFSLFLTAIYLSMKMQNLDDQTGRKLFMFFWNGGYFPHLSTKIFEKQTSAKIGADNA